MKQFIPGDSTRPSQVKRLVNHLKARQAALDANGGIANATYRKANNLFGAALRESSLSEVHEANRLFQQSSK